MDELELRNELHDALQPIYDSLDDLAPRHGWDYQVYEWLQGHTWQGITGANGIERMLTTFGAENWELVTAVESGGTIMYLFKRPSAPE